MIFPDNYRDGWLILFIAIGTLTFIITKKWFPFLLESIT